MNVSLAKNGLPLDNTATIVEKELKTITLISFAPNVNKYATKIDTLFKTNVLAKENKE